jgi:hypothetical protein
MAVDEAAAAGPVRLEADQLYADNGKRPWPISLTVVPADEDSQLVIWASVAGIFVLATAAIIAVAVLRQGRTLQER